MRYVWTCHYRIQNATIGSAYIPLPSVRCQLPHNIHPSTVFGNPLCVQPEKTSQDALQGTIPPYPVAYALRGSVSSGEKIGSLAVDIFSEAGPKPKKSPVHYLPNPLPGEAENIPDCLHGHRFFVIEAEIELQDGPLPVRQDVEHPPHQCPGFFLIDPGVRGGSGVLDEIPEGMV